MTARQRKFVREYMIDLNGTQAAIRAGYSKRSAGHIAYDMLNQSAPVKEAVAKAVAARSERLAVSQERVIRELARIAFSDWRDFAELGSDGLQLRADAELSDDAGAAIVEIHARDDGRPPRIKLHAKRTALMLLARCVGLTGSGRAGRWHEPEESGEDAREVLRRMLDKVEQMPEPEPDAPAAE